ncbi:MAG: hypothetical protein ABIF85_06655 [Nanoarchaeota archaeon]|nr:hypothetical protein [Nanoarchaeota archaeon]MBU4300551.1 hypothetical protein [Nanoarchaeota archaeon]MBU4451329.1 hypothetical protein [Nanoarchaeota archaeon]MCG2723290.1 hypothetical protein [archaeon]
MVDEKMLVKTLDEYIPMHAVVSLHNGLRVASDSEITAKRADEVAAYSETFFKSNEGDTKVDSKILSFYNDLKFEQLTEKIGAAFLLTVLYPADFDITKLQKINETRKPRISECLYEVSKVVMPKEPAEEKPKVPGFESYF